MLILIAIRDALVILALSWVGVSIEPREPQDRSACQADICIGAD